MLAGLAMCSDKAPIMRSRGDQIRLTDIWNTVMPITMPAVNHNGLIRRITARPITA